MSPRQPSSTRNRVLASPDERREEKARESTLDKLPPHDLEAERGVLGSILYLPIMLDELVGRLTPDEFYSDANREVFIAMNNIHAAGRRVDTTLLVDRLKRANMLDFIGGLAYLIEIADSTPHASNCLYYADIVRDLAMKRKLIYAATELLRAAYDPTSKPKEIAAAAETAIGDIAAARNADQLVNIVDVAKSRMAKIKAKKEPKRGLRTGLHALDRIIDGYECGHFNVIAARTSVGKTALATSHVTEWLERDGLVGYFCSLEMSDEEVVERVLVNHASVDLYRFRNHYLGEEELQRLQNSINVIQGSKKLFIDFAAERTVSEILSMARRVKRMAGRLDYVIVDYLQMIESEDKYAKRHEAVAKISRQLKIGARTLDCPLIVLAQLNRETEKSERPKLSHLRESGAIEQDADKVVFIHRSTDDDDGVNSRAELIVAKNRHGKVGDAHAAFFGSYQRFQSMNEDAAF
jgi:replicative DNA helicase